MKKKKKRKSREKTKDKVYGNCILVSRSKFRIDILRLQRKVL